MEDEDLFRQRGPGRLLFYWDQVSTGTCGFGFYLHACVVRSSAAERGLLGSCSESTLLATSKSVSPGSSSGSSHGCGVGAWKHKASGVCK